MAARASVESSGISRSRTPTPIGVYRYAPTSDGGDGAREFLPNVKALLIEYREGPDPGFARFAYALDSNGADGVPRSFVDVLSVDTALPGVVQNDERLLVVACGPDGGELVLFDGFAQVPELSLASGSEDVTFSAFGVAYRLWDIPIAGALMRNADQPETGDDCETDLDVRFNPLGEPNATPSGADADAERENPSAGYPTFLDHKAAKYPDSRRRWTLPMAAKYLCFHENSDQKYVRNPAPDYLDALLVEKAIAVSEDESEDAALVDTPIPAPDFTATGMAWPDALHELIDPEGFGMVFRVETDGNGESSTRLDLFRRQDPYTTSVKDLFLQPVGSSLSPGESNLGETHIVRDVTEIHNEIAVEPALTRYEASFILAPGFEISPADAHDADSIAGFSLNHPSFGTVRNRYRLYVFDETGDGHWNWSTSAIDKTAPSLKSLIGEDAAGRTLRRRRIPFGELFSKDGDGRVLRASLSISTDYSGPQPGLWNGTGTWQSVGGGFELTRDRLGVWINVPNPNGWNIHGHRTTSSAYPAGIVKGVEDQARPDGRRFVLRLTCVIEGDKCDRAVAERRPSSPTRYSRVRRVPAKNRFFKHVVSSYSEFNTSGKSIVVRDDADDAMTEARNKRLAEELGRVAGRVVIPRFTTAYRIGDRIGSIQGRSLSFRVNAGAPAGEFPVHPAVVGLSWVFDGGQKTILQLSDQRTNRS